MKQQNSNRTKHYGTSSGGVDMTLSELQEMATRQQHQIEAQQQMLVAKEQRLKFLKQQELRHQQIASENERLRQLREKVESQELKLKKLLALRGQVNEHKGTNSSLNAELETIKALFNEKEKELAVAVTKVDQMTRQLEFIRNNKPAQSSRGNATLHELEKLRKELVMRNKLNEAQNAKLSALHDVLVGRKTDVTDMDQRIAELQARLRRKKAAASSNQQQNDAHFNLTNHMRSQAGKIPGGQRATNIAAVEPYIQHKPSSPDPEALAPMKGDTKYQTLPRDTKFKEKSLEDGKKAGTEPQQPAPAEHWHQRQVSADAGLARGDKNSHKAPTTGPAATNKVPSTESAAVANKTPVAGQVLAYHSVDDPRKNASDQQPGPPTTRYGAGYRPGMTNFTARPYGSTFSTSVRSGRPSTAPNLPSPGLPASTPSSHPAQYPLTSTPLVSRTEKPENHREIFITGPASPGQQSVAGSSQPYPSPPPGYQTGSQPVSSATDTTSASGREAISEDAYRREASAAPVYQVVNALPVKFSHRHETSTDFSFNEPQEIPHPEASPSASHLDGQAAMASASSGYSSSNTSAGSIYSGAPNASTSSVYSRVASPTKPPPPRYAPKSVIANTYLKKLGGANLDQYRQNMNDIYRDFIQKETFGGEGSVQSDGGSNSTLTASFSGGDSTKDKPHDARDSPTQSDSPTPSVAAHDLDAERSHYRPNAPTKLRRRSSGGEFDDLRSIQVKMSRSSEGGDHPDNVVSMGELQDACDTQEHGRQDGPSEQQIQAAESVIPVPATNKKSNLRRVDYVPHSNRVCFDPLALLLDASLEGELELVKRTARQVHDPSTANDEGITALHNAICAGHYEIVKFLVEFGCNVNSPDSDGWTPLHCAASCNNLPMVKILVEHGACIFATTISDQETAAEKCEEDEIGYDGCSEYLYSVQEKLGIINQGVVYAVFDYNGENADEITFVDGNALTVMRKGDEHEREWWWSRMGDREGYIPRNLLGLFPRVRPAKSETENTSC